MPDLKCSVTKCNYNCSGLCCLSQIAVSGGGRKENTCCVSFTDSPSASNATSRNVTADKKTSVECSACDCEHNKNYSCHADSIGICKCRVCRCEPCTCDDTECSSFKKQNDK